MKISGGKPWLLSLIFLILGACSSTPAVKPEPTPPLSPGAQAWLQSNQQHAVVAEPSAAGLAPSGSGIDTPVKALSLSRAPRPAPGEASASCTGVPNGSVVTGYLSETVTRGMSCVPATKTCMNGAWAGPEVYSTCLVQ